GVSAVYGSDGASLELERGVPQGSALGPFLFLLSTLPLVDEFAGMEEKGVSLTLYADDTTVMVSGGTGPSLVERWRSAEALLLAWAAEAVVSYEPAKSQALLPRTIGDHVLSLDGVPVDIVKVVRVLGVWIDHRLSFQHHIRLKVSEAKAKLGRLRHLGWARAGITGRKIIKTYKVAIQPALAHAVVAWKEGLESATAKSVMLQVTAMVARIALQAPRNSSNAALCVAAGLLPADLELKTTAAARLSALGCARALDQCLAVKGLVLSEGHGSLDKVQCWRGLPTPPWEPSVKTTIRPKEEAKRYAQAALLTGNAIFTDGSGVELHASCWKLSPYATITDCELLGVLEAVRWVVSAADQEESWEVFMDSQAVLKILSSRSTVARRDKARQITLLLAGLPDKVTFHWVPGHSGMPANDRADELAAKGASMTEVSSETEISVRTLRRYQAEAGLLSLRKKRVKGGVPYHFYKMVVDLKRRKAFNRLFEAMMQHLDARRGLL
ncbi:hypothetical protein FOL47_003566, partial [Perkinsus chesapeaki]